MSEYKRNYSRTRRGWSRSRSPRYDRDRGSDRGSEYSNENPRREHSRRHNRDYYDNQKHSNYRPDRQVRSRSIEHRRRNPNRDRRHHADRDKYSHKSQNSDVLRNRREDAKELTMPIWAPTPTISEDEKDRLDEESIINKMQNKLNAVSSKLHSDTGSESYSEGSSDGQSARRSRKHRKRRSEKRSKSHRSKRKRSKTAHRRRRDTSDESDEFSQEERGHGHDKQNIKPDDLGARRYSLAESEKSDESEPEVGPIPVQSQQLNAASAMHGLGKAMHPSGGTAMATNTHARGHLSRQGEISKEKIGRLESAGYVMSGNRHRRVNDVHSRKEGQTISTEEKRQMLLQSQEERQQKEMQIISEFRDMLAKRK